ncbi:MAG TPA: hypothetical protein VIF60_07885 [Burkholderiaceae bacterium]|jgi:hypothetical protein
MFPTAQSALVTKAAPKSSASDIREGDWEAYQRQSKNSGRSDFVTSNDNLAAYRRQCALAYLGKRAQVNGCAYSKMQVRTFTPRFLFELGDVNKNRRFSRYPWLGKLIDLIAEIEREQEQACASGNVVSLMGAMK